MVDESTIVALMTEIARLRSDNEELSRRVEDLAVASVPDSAAAFVPPVRRTPRVVYANVGGGGEGGGTEGYTTTDEHGYDRWIIQLRWHQPSGAASSTPKLQALYAHFVYSDGLLKSVTPEDNWEDVFGTTPHSTVPIPYQV